MRTFAERPMVTQQATSAKSAISSRAHFGQGCGVDLIHHLQRTIGNQAVQRLLQGNAEGLNGALAGTASPHFGHNFSWIPKTLGLQSKLKINLPNDEYEQEADRIADQVMRMPEPKLPEACASDGGCPKCAVEPSKCRGVPVQAKAGRAFETTPEFHSRINTLDGRPLPENERKFFEPRFGMDFSKVRIHTDSNAAQMAASIQAKAFTAGKDIVFGQGEYLPGTTSSRRLLAHELTHTVQQAAVEETYEPPTIRRQCPANNTRRSNGLAKKARLTLSSWVSPAVKLSRVNAKMIQREPACSRMAIPYAVGRGDTATIIARRHHTTLECLRRLNPGVDFDRIRAGQSINIPVSTCSVPVPTDSDKQLLAGVIFAEAVPSRIANDEREAIASTFQNRVFHVRDWDDAAFCPSMTGAGRSRQKAQDARNFGSTLLQSITTGSAAYGGGQWNKVMTPSNTMKTSADICAQIHSGNPPPAIQPGELAPLHRAIQAANAMYGIRGRRFFVGLNKAPDSPPSLRMELGVRIAAHSFYQFKQGRECG